MKAPKVKAKPLESSTQVMGKNEILLKKEHKAIYDYFVKVLEGKAKLKENKGITDHFISAYNNIPLDNVNLKDINSLSEENFCQFLLSAFKEVREKKLANKENLENDERKKLVDDCVADIRVTEAKDSLIKLIGLPLGIKIDPKNISSSFMNGVKEKIPFLSKDKKEEDEPPLSDEEMVTAFVRKVFIPVLFSVASILIFGPTTLAVFAAVIGTIFAVKGGVEVLFSNNKKGTLYDPSSQDKDDTEKRARLNEKIRNGIDDILKTPIERPLETIADGSKKQPTPEQASQVGNKGGEQLTVLDEQVTVDQLVEEQGQAVK